jgi:SWI/SNF-related matrix-associated actin-dependent regulator of chromatin subfamily A3
LSADFCRGQSILDRIEWYRVVLDEGTELPTSSDSFQKAFSANLVTTAHILRNSSTKQFRAICAIPTQIRWCLTGTPIQNSLEDLGALVKFLRVPILEDTPIFRKHIITPIHLSTSGRFKSLQLLLESLCLRRTKGLLNLPEPVIVTNVLELSVTEKETYLDFGGSCKRAIDRAVSGHSMKKANQIVIQALLGMRLFCNHDPAGLLGKWVLWPELFQTSH